MTCNSLVLSFYPYQVSEDAEKLTKPFLVYFHLRSTSFQNAFCLVCSFQSA